MPRLPTSFGPCDVHVEGPDDAPTVVLVHGVLVNSTVWDPIVPGLAAHHRVVRPDLPIGAHALPAEHRDRLDPETVADALAEILDGLGIDRAAVIGSDTGGAISQIFAARHPDRLSGLVLLSCDALDHFPPTILKPVVATLRIPGSIDLMSLMYRSKRMRRTFVGVGLLLTEPVDDALVDAWFDRIVADREARRDMGAFLRGCRKELTHRAADALAAQAPPVLLAWSRGDRLFPESDAEELHRRIAGSSLHYIDDARTFSQIDRPQAVLDLVVPFLAGLPAPA
ncbi:MAG TPA: alpha/beta hydrolase [Iamia sp.]